MSPLRPVSITICEHGCPASSRSVNQLKIRAREIVCGMRRFRFVWLALVSVAPIPVRVAGAWYGMRRFRFVWLASGVSCADSGSRWQGSLFCFPRLYLIHDPLIKAARIRSSCSRMGDHCFVARDDDVQAILARARDAGIRVRLDRGGVDVRPPSRIEDLIRLVRRHRKKIAAALWQRNDYATGTRASRERAPAARTAGDLPDGAGPILAALSVRPSSTVDLADALNTDTYNISRVIGALAGRGLVREVRIPGAGPVWTRVNDDQ